jgi:signal transduction histidine kinase
VNRHSLKRCFWIPAIVFALGTLSTFILLCINQINTELHRDSARANTIMDMQLKLALSHLWLEQSIAGDASINMEKVWKDMDSVAALTDSLLSEEGSEQPMVFAPIAAPESRIEVESIRSLLAEFRSLVVKRCEEPEESGIGTPQDARCDKIFKEIITRGAILEDAAVSNQNRDETYSKRFFVAILAIWVAIVVVTVIGFWNRELQKKVAEESLLEARDELERRVAERTREMATANEQLRLEVSERKKVEKFLRESEGKFRKLSLEFHALLDAIPDRLTLLAPDLCIRWANKGAVVAAGRDGAALTGAHCYQVWHDLSAPCEDCPARRSFVSGRPEHTEVSAPNGRFWDVRTFPVQNDEGKVINVILLITDVTERVAFQSEAMRVAHLTSLGELAAGIAHEVNNPVNCVINYGQILSNTSTKGTEPNDLAGRIIKEGNRIAAIVKGLLSFAREKKEEKSPVPVIEIMNDSLILAKSQMLKQGIRLSVDLPSDLPQVIANLQQIEQVFLNIISNARYALNEKYPGPHGNKLLEILGATENLDGLPCVKVSFIDHGCGIPHAIIDKVMVPFFSTKPSGKGTGLGLSITHGIVNDHGGMLKIRSKEGEWTEVVVILPAKGEV